MHDRHAYLRTRSRDKASLEVSGPLLNNTTKNALTGILHPSYKYPSVANYTGLFKNEVDYGHGNVPSTDLENGSIQVEGG